jgi:hypothetical protein
MTATTTAKIAAKKIVFERLLPTFLSSDIVFIDATDAEFCSPVTGGHGRRGVYGPEKGNLAALALVACAKHFRLHDLTGECK